MKIGIVGSEGIVGKAISYGFEKLGHEVKRHDLLLKTELENVFDCEIVYICVPTPIGEMGQCDTSIVETIVRELDIKHKSTISNQIVVIKSTVSPGTTYRFQEKYPHAWLAFVPEFLRERCAVVDFTESHDVCIIGTNTEWVFDKIKESHGHFPKKFIQLEPIEAEFVKYFNNVYNATLITFANSFYEVCKKSNVNYTKIKAAAVHRKHITDMYLDANEGFRGFGGACLPKDVMAMARLVKWLELDVDFFDDLLKENNKYKTTVLEGMRNE